MITITLSSILKQATLMQQSSTV